jgi:elongator complex protein 3
MGGTFPSFSKRYKENFIKYSIKAMNDFSSLFFKKELDLTKFKEFFELPGDINNKERIKRIQKKLLSIKNKGDQSLKNIQKQNETASIRDVALCIETRPDYAKLKHAKEMLRLGCTRVELGVQTIYDNVLKKIQRGHTVKDSIKATLILKNLGFKVSYHMMPGLPGVDKKHDLFSLALIVRDQNFMPDMLKIYPCMVLKGTKLHGIYKKGRYKPLTTKKAADLIVEFKKIAPEYLRISRVQRDIPTFITESGVDMTNLRQYIQKLLKKKRIKCRCIRCREAGHVLNRKPNIKIRKIEIHTTHYEASNGSEFFISAEDTKNDILFGYCKLRFPQKSFTKEITGDSALIRELHVFSPAVAIGKRSRTSFQHKGIGKGLLKEAERITKSYFRKKVVVISGIGAREYYKKLGYKKQGPYMVKKL